MRMPVLVRFSTLFIFIYIKDRLLSLFSSPSTIGALVGGLRRKVDDLLSKKITNPRFEVAKSVEMKLIVKLLRTDGMG